MTLTRSLIVAQTFAATLFIAGLGFAEDNDSAKTVTSAESFVVETHHRAYTNFKQIDTVGFADPFYIGEEEWEARIILFNPHLGITMKGEALQMSDSLRNPAIRIRVEHADTLIQESWGFFFTDAPHFRRENMLGFRLLEYNVGDEYIPVPPPETEPASPKEN